MSNLLPEGAANHPLAPYNDPKPRCDYKSTLAPGEASRVVSEAMTRMEAAGMKPVELNKTFNR